MSTEAEGLVTVPGPGRAVSGGAGSQPRLVVNADDFGWDNDTVEATIDAFERGLLTSATIMANMPASGDAIEWARAHPEFSFGVHLVWSSDGPERPLSDAGEIPSLLRSDGRLRGSTPMRIRGLLRLTPVQEIALEMRRQIDAVRDAGIPVSHVDSHGHLHKYAAFRAALAQVLPELGITRVRTVQDLYLRPRRWSPTVWLGRSWRRDLARSFRTTDHFYMPGSDGATEWERNLPGLVRRLGGVVEIGVHPGRGEPWRSDELHRLARVIPQLVEQGAVLIDWRAL